MGDDLQEIAKKYRDLIVNIKELDKKRADVETAIINNKRSQDEVASQLRKCVGTNIPERHIVLSDKMILIITKDTVKLVQGE